MLLQIHEPGETPEPHNVPKTAAIGIDLGTTNSVVAVAEGQKPTILRDAQGMALIPSVVAYQADVNIPPLVGVKAVHQMITQPDSVVTSIKRLMGREQSDLKPLAGTLPYEIIADTDNKGGMVALTLAGRRLTPIEISADILRALRQHAEEKLQDSVTQAVITVPAYFDDAARTATRDAARLAGLEVLRLVNEPTAAALAYGLDKAAEGIYAIYDLGGGTFDISILRLEKGVFQVLATGGDTALGGDDFDHNIAEAFLAQLEIDSVSSAQAKQLLTLARQAKEDLTQTESGHWEISLFGVVRELHLTRVEFDSLIAPLVAQTGQICRAVLADAGLEPNAIQGIVLVGGSTRVPLVRRAVEDLFGRMPLSTIDPDEVVALGAALQAEALTRGSDTLLLDITPLSLGIETMGGLVEKVIHRNSPIPVSKAQDFTTYQNGQTKLLVHVVQGERETVQECRSLARFVLSDIPPMTAGAARIRVTFMVDADGLLTVTAREESLGIEQRIEVKPSYGLSDQDMARMIRDSMVHAQDDMLARLLINARVEAERVLHALAAALAADGVLLDTTARARIDEAARQLQQAMDDRDRDRITGAMEILDQVTASFAQARMDRAFGGALRGQKIEDVTSVVGEGDFNTGCDPGVERSGIEPKTVTLSNP